MYQTRTVELPSDSTFAIAMKTQQQAEREEQQRIKNLVLNYDLQQNEDQDGGNERPATFYHNRLDRSGKDRGQRSRKLQLSDVDW
jgi:regulator of nonsense transcripts 2